MSGAMEPVNRESDQHDLARLVHQPPKVDAAFAPQHLPDAGYGHVEIRVRR